MALAIASTALSSLPTRELHKKISLGKFTTCLPGRRTSHLDATKGVSSVCEPLPPDRPLWFPGSSPPEWLDGSLPGDFGFDPLGLEFTMGRRKVKEVNFVPYRPVHWYKYTLCFVPEKIPTVSAKSGCFSR
ncbi:photosystem I chlorophyll a/b-binding protein 6, chloroplastic-like [Quercus robur]|uniref:photosystem I chlorophyll a/b-binding protein 6, chloroplastic-like n=1 Tax=Quercus robur TaxID=38942 RepID=UPI0021628568|nr:photosystem I chlorophyll a/b-binding protein 6, chloroplastic-like [Quercus robur]